MRFEIGKGEREKEEIVDFWLEKRDENKIILMAGKRGTWEGWHIASLSKVDGKLHKYMHVPDNIGLALDGADQIKVEEDRYA